MKLTKKELIDHLDQYPDDYELNLSHYFLVEVSPAAKGKNKGKPNFMQAQVNIPIVGTAADKKSKEIRLVLKSSDSEVLERIEQGGVHPIPAVIEAEEAANEPVDDEKKAVSVA